MSAVMSSILTSPRYLQMCAAEERYPAAVVLSICPEPSIPEMYFSRNLSKTASSSSMTSSTRSLARSASSSSCL